MHDRSFELHNNSENEQLPDALTTPGRVKNNNNGKKDLETNEQSPDTLTTPGNDGNCDLPRSSVQNVQPGDPPIKQNFATITPCISQILCDEKSKIKLPNSTAQVATMTPKPEKYVSRLTSLAPELQKYTLG